MIMLMNSDGEILIDTREIKHNLQDFDKVKECGLTLVDADTISVPALKEFPLTLECKVIYKVRQDGKEIPQDVMERFYPEWEQNPEDLHTVYYGLITAAYIIEE